MDKKPATPPPQIVKVTPGMVIPGLTPGTTAPNNGGKPMVVVVMKGAGGKGGPMGLPQSPAGKKKKSKGSKSKGGKKKTKKSGKKKPNGEDESDSDSDRMGVPDIPTAHTHKPPAGAAPSPAAAKPATPVKPPPKKVARPGMKKENFLIKDGNVDKPCVPQYILVDGPAGSCVVVPLDARDESATVPELNHQPLKGPPKETVKGFMLYQEDGLLYFKPAKDCPTEPPASTAGQLMKFMGNSNIFVADKGPALPDEKAYNPAATTQKDKVGDTIAVSGHITILSDKGTCRFTRVSATNPFPFYPPNAAMGVLVKDITNGNVFFVPTENRFVGPVLALNVRPLIKAVAEAAVVGNIYKDASGAAVWEIPSEKKDNLMGYIMSSATGVPIYVSKPGDANAPKGVGAAASPAASPATSPAPGKEGEAVQDQFKKMMASQTELPPEPAQPEQAAEGEQQEEEEAPAPPPPPTETQKEYKKFMEDRSKFC